MIIKSLLFTIILTALTSMPAASAYAYTYGDGADLAGDYVTAADAQTGGKLVKGHKARIYCMYQFPFFVDNVPAWRVRFQVDGKTIGTASGEPPQPDKSCKTLGCFQTPAEGSSSVYWTPLTAGLHHAQCTLDSGGTLKAAGLHVESPTLSGDLEVDIAPVLSVVKSKPSGVRLGIRGNAETSASHAGSLAARRPNSVNPVLAAKLPEPHLVLRLGADPIEGCTLGQAVVLVHGNIKNVGSGPFFIAPGQPVATIQSLVGVYGGKITSGNLSPGQLQPVSVKLKPKGFPAALAGATLKLHARINYAAVGKESSYGGNEQDMTVSFPANFCKPKLRVSSPAGLRAQPRAARSAAPMHRMQPASVPPQQMQIRR